MDAQSESSSTADQKASILRKDFSKATRSIEFWSSHTIPKPIASSKEDTKRSAMRSPKYCEDPEKKDWLKHLHLTSWITVRRSMGYPAFDLVYGRGCLLPINFSLASWIGKEVRTYEDFILARMRQLDEGNLTIMKSAEQLESSRRANKHWFNQHQRLRTENQQLKFDDLIASNNRPRQLCSQPEVAR